VCSQRCQAPLLSLPHNCTLPDCPSGTGERKREDSSRGSPALSLEPMWTQGRQYLSLSLLLQSARCIRPALVIGLHAHYPPGDLHDPELWVMLTQFESPVMSGLGNCLSMTSSPCLMSINDRFPFRLLPQILPDYQWWFIF
jgi:hypothetical protein